MGAGFTPFTGFLDSHPCQQWTTQFRQDNAGQDNRSDNRRPRTQYRIGTDHKHQTDGNSSLRQKGQANIISYHSFCSGHETAQPGTEILSKNPGNEIDQPHPTGKFQGRKIQVHTGQGEKQNINGRLKGIYSAKQPHVTFRPVNDGETGHHPSQQGGKMQHSGNLAAQQQQSQTCCKHFPAVMQFM